MVVTVPRMSALSWDLSVGAVWQASLSLFHSAVLMAERSGCGERGLLATVPSYHEAAALLRVEGACCCRTFQTHPEVGRSRGGRKVSTVLAFLAGSGVRTCLVVLLWFKTRLCHTGNRTLLKALNTLRTFWWLKNNLSGSHHAKTERYRKRSFHTPSSWSVCRIQGRICFNLQIHSIILHLYTSHRFPMP